MVVSNLSCVATVSYRYNTYDRSGTQTEFRSEELFDHGESTQLTGFPVTHNQPHVEPHQLHYTT